MDAKTTVVDILQAETWAKFIVDVVFSKKRLLDFETSRIWSKLEKEARCALLI